MDTRSASAALGSGLPGAAPALFPVPVLLPLLALLLMLAGCGGPGLEAASRQYQAERDYESLVALHAALKPGMSRAQVERLLGPPDYSPIDGQVYYGSDARDDSRDPPATIGLVLDYRDRTGADLGTLQTIRFGPIGE